MTSDSAHSAPSPHPSDDYLSNRSYNAVRRGAGQLADTLEGIALIGPSRVAAMRGVGQSVLEEISLALEDVGLKWGNNASRLPPPRTPRHPPTGVLSETPITPPAESGQPKTRRADEILVQRLLDAGSRGDSDVARELLRTFSDDIREAVGNHDRRADILIARILEGRTLEEIGKEHNLTRERARQLSAPANQDNLSNLSHCLTHGFIARRGDEIRHIYRTGSDLPAAIEPLLSDEPSVRAEAVWSSLPDDLFTTRDKSIRWLMRTSDPESRGKHWSEADLLLGIQRVSLEHCGGRAPKIEEYKRARHRDLDRLGSTTLASTATITNRLGSWNSALGKAGFQVAPHGPRGDKHWTAERVIRSLIQLTVELDELPPVHRYDIVYVERRSSTTATNLPSAGTVRVELGHQGLGRWREIRALVYRTILARGTWEI